MSQDKRASWPRYFMDIAHLVAQRSTCLRRKVGAIAVLDRRILATGYNGAPSGVPHCLEVGCLRQQMGIPSGQRHEICRGIHAEQNVIIQAAVHGISLRGAEIFCTTQPCIICAKMLINCGVKKIWIAEGYPDELSEKMLEEAGVEVVVLPAEEGRGDGKIRPVELSGCACASSSGCSCGGKA
ncbi:MAG: cytidine/deoxycytidylate deaminase family protein [Mailhella sp.]|nr:cytidine/deoxycytidylate deaminase family protein [Mailhella sp.]